jgi:kynurenine formamidase
MEIIDLSKTIINGSHAHITTTIAPLIRIGEAASKFEAPCEGFAANLLVMSDHCGTHMDAPHHFIREGETIEHIPMNRMVGPAVVCDLSEIEGDQIEGTDLCRAIDRMEQKVRPGGFILLKTRSKEGPGKGLSLSAAEHLVHIGVSLVGTDSGGIDIGRNRNRPGHMTLLRNKVLIVESLTNLDRLLGQEFLFVAAPLAIEGGTGSPVRPIAICPYIEAQWPVLT